jgi:pyruvate,water dikinase
MTLVLWFRDIGRGDVGKVGGKNASLGEMVGTLAPRGVRVPDGFATTADAYWQFMAANGLQAPVTAALAQWESGAASLSETGSRIRALIGAAPFPADLAEAICTAYRQLALAAGNPTLDVAVRSSATAEDLPDASFAGQQESFLNIRGETALLAAARRCFASLFTDRAISYRKTRGFDHMKVALSIGVQRMVRSDVGASGVMFTLDTETGFPGVVLINGAWGLGENVVQGAVDPDEFCVFKPLLARTDLVPIITRRLGAKAKKMIYWTGHSPTRNIPTSKAERGTFVLDDAAVLELARWAVIIEDHYGRPMDIEWARDGITGEMFIVQARPETVRSRQTGADFTSVSVAKGGEVLVRGIAIGDRAASGLVCRIDNPRDLARFPDGAILVTGNTDPDWVPLMKRASAIVTDHGGRTSHAAIVSRELGLPAIVGAGNATTRLSDGMSITVACSEGEVGTVYAGALAITETRVDPGALAATRTQLMLNLGDPGAAFRWWRLGADGVGLARMEFVISNAVRAHPMALLHPERVTAKAERARIARLVAGWESGADYFVHTLARGLSRLAAALYPKPVIVRMSDFKTNEYAGLMGGRDFEPKEENPMIGFRGASRYYSEAYREGFALECAAIRYLRETMGFSNVVVMIPFCRTPDEADRVLAEMANSGLRRGENGLEVYVMCEIPSNVILAEEFAKRFDGFSIGSNDLTQLTLGVDRDSGPLAKLFDEQDAAVRWMISTVIEKAGRSGSKVGLCGQAPSDHPEFAKFLVAAGIDSISVTPDSFMAVKQQVAAAEAEMNRRP